MGGQIRRGRIWRFWGAPIFSPELPKTLFLKGFGVPNPPGANPLVAERAFPTSDYWGRTGVARCAEEMTGICRDFQ